MAAVGGFVFLAEQTLDIGARREVARQTAQAYCQKADKQDCKTLNTDVRSARADEDAVDVAVWQLWLNVAGIVGLAFTVLYARAAWRESQSSASTAERALHGQERPLLLTSSMKVGDLARDQTPEDDGMTELQHRMINHGQGVAWVLSHVVAVKTVPSGVAPTLQEPDIEPTIWPIATGAWFGSTITQGDGFPLSVADRKRVIDGTLDLYFYGAAHYRDNSRRKYLYRFAYKYRRSDKLMVPFDHPFWEHT